MFDPQGATETDHGGRMSECERVTGVCRRVAGPVWDFLGVWWGKGSERV